MLLGVRAVDRAPDRFSFLLALGVVLLLAVQVTANLGVATATLPPTGFALPFLSYGGSSLLLVAAMVGVLSRVAHCGIEPAPLCGEQHGS